jgi:hypothetical protein
MSDLRSRTGAYLRGPCIISEPGASLTRLIARYVASEPWDDPELRNRVSRCLQAVQTEAARLEGATTGPARDAQLFYQRGASLLQDIQAEVSAGGVEYRRDCGSPTD